MRQPGFVEVQRADLAVQQLLERLDVVDNPVVGALRDRQDARLPLGVPLLSRSCERIGLDLLLNRFRSEFRQRNRPDDAQMIARRRQEDRDGPGHDDRVQDRLVAVAVDDHDVARGDRRVPDHLVRGRRAVGHEEAVVGVENSGRVPFRGRDRAGVVQQLTEFFDRVADVGPQHVLAEELVKHLPDGTLQKRDAARVTGAMPGVRTVLGVVNQRSKKRRSQTVGVGRRLANDVPGHELRRVLEHMNEAVQLPQNVVRDVAARSVSPRTDRSGCACS